MKVKYYLTSSGRSPVEEFILDLPENTPLEIADAIALLESGQRLEMPLSRNLSSIKPGLHELRFRDKAGQVRVLYFLKKGEAIYLIHAFRKKTQAIPPREMDLILKRLKEV
ncbi:MAG: type II toxin-antitoxin system RelE/ParE family toxin [Deltaproteobacteria bacterium]|nr:type II toxin-antitoxin system RelE/ParE family toxin [Deltaproteobacteria bacterium]